MCVENVLFTRKDVCLVPAGMHVCTCVQLCVYVCICAKICLLFTRNDLRLVTAGVCVCVCVCVHVCTCVESASFIGKGLRLIAPS
jgi:hypothetical protein